jgi:hypothetical protein
MHHPQIAVALLLTAATQRDGKRRREFYTARFGRSVTACKSLCTQHGVAAGGKIRGYRRVVLLCEFGTNSAPRRNSFPQSRAEAAS